MFRWLSAEHGIEEDYGWWVSMLVIERNNCFHFFESRMGRGGGWWVGWPVKGTYFGSFDGCFVSAWQLVGCVNRITCRDFKF